MDEYLIKVERDSVCMGDDAHAPHAYTFNTPKGTTLNQLFEHLAKKHYLASVAGKDHSWDAAVNNKVVAIFQGNSKTPEPSKWLSTQVSQFAKNDKVNVRFKYNSAAT